MNPDPSRLPATAPAATVPGEQCSSCNLPLPLGVTLLRRPTLARVRLDSISPVDSKKAAAVPQLRRRKGGGLPTRLANRNRSKLTQSGTVTLPLLRTHPSQTPASPIRWPTLPDHTEKTTGQAQRRCAEVDKGHQGKVTLSERSWVRSQGRHGGPY